MPTASGSANAATSSGQIVGHAVQPAPVDVGDQQERGEPALGRAVADATQLVVTGLHHDPVADAARS